MRTTAAFIIPLALTTCGPERGDEPSEQGRQYAGAVCESIQDCGCEPRFTTQGDCEQELSARFDEALSDGLTLDEGCFERMLPTLQGCGTLADVDPGSWCPVFQGLKLGEPCRRRTELPLLEASGCDEGLVCSIGERVCVEAGTPAVVPPTKREGDRCDPRDSQSCGAIGFYCAADGRCERNQEELGGVCDAPWSCSSVYNWYCKGENLEGKAGVCSELEALGDPCDPRDYFPCRDGWCDPSMGVCTPWDDAPRVCLAASFPPAGPWPP